MPDIIFGSTDWMTSGTDIAPGGLTAQSPYVTVLGADEYFNDRLNSQAWDLAESNDKTRALKTATKYINRLNFIGTKTDSNQPHQFPRGGDTEVPQDVKDACCEIAYALIDGIDIEKERENLDMVSQGFGGVKSTYAREMKPAHILAGIPSIVAWNLLLPYLPDSRTISVTRV